MKSFEQKYCPPRALCATCRTDEAWRSAAGAPDICPFGITADSIPKPAIGVGTHFKRLLSSFGITEWKGCNCASLERQMNEAGPDAVEANLDDWTAKVLANAQNSPLLAAIPFKGAAIEGLLKAAVRRANTQ